MPNNNLNTHSVIRKLLFQIQRKFSHKPRWWRAHEDLIKELNDTKSNKDSMEGYGVRLTIPDGPPEEQLKTVNSWIDIMKTFAKIAGEEDQLDLSAAYAAKEKLEKQIKDEPNHSIGG